jgi:AraC family transcriptional regulator, positive regulator of tynA and feaB
MPDPARTFCSYDEVDSEALPPARRFAQWRETGLLPMAAEPADEEGRRRFRIRVRRLSGTAGRFADLTATSMKLRRSKSDCDRDGLDMIGLTLVLGTDVRHQFDSAGPSTVVRPGQILIKDFTRPATAAWQTGSHRGLNLHLPRLTVEAAVGDKITRLHGAVLSPAGLSPMLEAQLAILARIAPRAKCTVRAAALDATVELAGSVLRCEFGARLEDEANDAGLFAAAQVFIRRHLASSRLSPELVAQQLRCSRAHLYRVFAGRGETVAGYVRELRLRLAHSMLAVQADGEIRIGDIAYRCGFENPVHFTRLFRERFGLTPSALKATYSIPARPDRPLSEVELSEVELSAA